MKKDDTSVRKNAKKIKEIFMDFFKVEDKNDPWGADIILKPATELSPCSIVFTIKKEEVMKITEEGFFWKGRLVENDREVYRNVREFFIKVVGDYEKH